MENVTKARFERPSQIPVMPGDLHRVAEKVGHKYLHVWRWYNGKYRKPCTRHSQMLEALLDIYEGRKSLNGRAEALLAGQ